MIVREKQKQLAERDPVIFPFDRSENKGSKSKSHMPEVLQLIETGFSMKMDHSSHSSLPWHETFSTSLIVFPGNVTLLCSNPSKGVPLAWESLQELKCLLGENLPFPVT